MAPPNNPTIARLDRKAALLGLDLTRHGRNVRSFVIINDDGDVRTLKYKPGGKGVLRVEAYVNSMLDAECVASIERLERLMRSAAE